MATTGRGLQEPGEGMRRWMADHRSFDHSDEPVRMFRSDFLEFFTHIHPAVIVAIWAPVILAFLYTAVRAGTGLAVIVAGFVIGLFLWTLAEYLGHRFLFHFPPRTPAQARFIFMIHGVHHYQPKCKTRLVLPPAVSIPLGFVFYGFYLLVVGRLLGAPQWVAPLFAGFLLGYLTYDLTHYATHHFPMRGSFLKDLKRHHMVHHYKTPDLRFGVSSPLWDYVFGTEA